ncbi:hypothetical protein [Arthrobacter dokdonensis]|uniref:hypothetical protein n=1 Tax=Arthrobacter dokdonellae TaxID=2211210 RepID=UPI001013D004|nr:hypothetical protein [Arthrobacter dokdonellae]
MSTQKCRECLGAFEPGRPTQLYCSPSCSRASRDRRRAEKRRATSRATRQTLVAVERANAQERLLQAETDYQRQLKRESSSAEDKFHHAVLERDKTIDQQLTQLHHLAAVNVDLCGELAEAKAQTTELRLEVARILHAQNADAQDLMRLAARLLQLTDHLGIPLDRPTADIYRRRGWPTTMPARAR